MERAGRLLRAWWAKGGRQMTDDRTVRGLERFLAQRAGWPGPPPVCAAPGCAGPAWGRRGGPGLVGGSSRVRRVRPHRSGGRLLMRDEKIGDFLDRVPPRVPAPRGG